jgi:hypothetical protein
MLRNTCPLSFFWLIRSSDQEIKSFIRFMSYICHLWIRLTLFTMVFLCLLLLLDIMTRCHFNYQVFLLTFSCTVLLYIESRPALCACVSHFFTFTAALFHWSTAQLPSATSTTSHCTIRSCPNPSCIQNLRRTNKPFPSEKSFTHHLQQFPMCKAFLMEQCSIMSSNVQVPSKQASVKTTPHLFKKQWILLDPTFT